MNFKNYTNNVKALVDTINEKEFYETISLLKETQQKGKRIFFAGNGGSAASANHFSCDIAKNVVGDNGFHYRTLTVSSDSSTITALGNDIGFDNIFRVQLELQMDPGDILIAISASGNSPNIKRACEYVKDLNNKIIGLSGFNGGVLRQFADISFHVDSNEYEVVEDLHSIILHSIISYLKSETR